MTSRSISLPRGFRQYISWRPDYQAVLRVLLYAPVPLAGGEIAASAGLPRPAIQPILLRLRLDGIVTKVKEPGYSTPTYQLTPRGRQALEREPEVLQV